jgi:hypothetical protein
MSASFSALLGRTFRTGGPLLLLLLLLFVSAGNFRFNRPDSDCRSLLILGVGLSLDNLAYNFLRTEEKKHCPLVQYVFKV